MRILVTGASGFLGKCVIHHLGQRAGEVITAGRTQSAGTGAHRVIQRPDDTAEIDRLVREIAPDVIIHLAGATTAPSITDLYRANTVFAANLLQATASLSAPRSILLVGSAAEYGPIPSIDMPVKEDFPCRPNTSYGITKLAQTLHGLAAAANGLPVKVARVFNPIGPGMSASLALGSFAGQIARFGSKGGVLHTGNLNVVRDFIDVYEAARVLVEIAFRKEIDGEIVNVCTGIGRSLLDVTNTLISISGVPVELAYEADRTGNSNVSRFVGDPSKLAAYGISIAAPDLNRILRDILARARADASNDDRSISAI
jgi:GDP-4-dehydro-6-deoxy-D-mannose reductase